MTYNDLLGYGRFMFGYTLTLNRDNQKGISIRLMVQRKSKYGKVGKTHQLTSIHSLSLLPPAVAKKRYLSVGGSDYGMSAATYMHGVGSTGGFSILVQRVASVDGFTWWAQRVATTAANYQRAKNDFGSLCASGSRRSSMTEGKWLHSKAKDLELNWHTDNVDRSLGCRDVSCGLTTYSLSRILYYSRWFFKILNLDAMDKTRHFIGYNAYTGDRLLDGFDWLVQDIASRVYVLD
ncbi:hypothetical protein CTI12_AA127720 [Artemisia annua]|uniref:Uncharacterized protein n=1 Tax=Artemisia annua TaxID=35608 RepID=A0A2U1PPQ7_ARTAN|nr:hypothetical protein CTI12_AA127720 [Artemisia annua]